MGAKHFLALFLLIALFAPARPACAENPPHIQEHLESTRIVSLKTDIPLDQSIQCAAIRRDGMTAVVTRSSAIKNAHSVITLHTPEGDRLSTFVMYFDGWLNQAVVYFNENGQLCIFSPTNYNLSCDKENCLHRSLLLVELDIHTLEYTVHDTFALLHANHEMMFKGVIQQVDDITVITQNDSAYSLSVVTNRYLSIEDNETGEFSIIYNQLNAIEARAQEILPMRMLALFKLIAAAVLIP